MWERLQDITAGVAQQKISLDASDVFLCNWRSEMSNTRSSAASSPSSPTPTTSKPAAAARTQVERLTPALLAKAFRGELVPQDPNDEPAAVLLERIHALGVGRNKRSVSDTEANAGNGLWPYPGLRKKTREKT